jgi:hypothetical protein
MSSTLNLFLMLFSMYVGLEQPNFFARIHMIYLSVAHNACFLDY